MHEKYLSYLWRYRKLPLKDLRTTHGEPIEIIQTGELNTHSGPDFQNARIRIGETLWAGNVEIHVRASDWLRHRHQTDRAYDNTILHVVHQADMPISTTNQQEIPTLELQQLIEPSQYAKYMAMETEPAPIKCSQFIKEVPAIVWGNWLDRLLIERLEAKTAYIKTLVAQANGSWDEAFYHALSRSFGQKVNAEPFEALARSLPSQVLAKHKTQLFQLEALFFGQAGMLQEQMQDDYAEPLRKEYAFLRHKYKLTPIDAVQWKFFRLRPAAFPTVRIAQFAALVFQASHLFSKVLEAKSVRALHHLFRAEISDYWKTHYRFEAKETKASDKPLSKDLIDLVIYNTILPFWFLYGRERQLPDLERRALACYEEMPAESNSLLDEWIELGKKPANAAQAQALLELRKQYCDQKRCTQCAAGVWVLK